MKLTIEKKNKAVSKVLETFSGFVSVAEIELPQFKPQMQPN